MSRSRKGSKGPGYDYWSKRPGTKKASDPGKYAKKINHRLERIEGKNASKDGLKDLQFCPICDCFCELDAVHTCGDCGYYTCECEC